MEKFDIIITIFAAMVVSVVNYILGVDLLTFATRLIIVIIVFYIFGFFIKFYINTKIFPKIDEGNNIENTVDNEEIAEYDENVDELGNDSEL